MRKTQDIITSALNAPNELNIQVMVRYKHYKYLQYIQEMCYNFTRRCRREQKAKERNTDTNSSHVWKLDVKMC